MQIPRAAALAALFLSLAPVAAGAEDVTLTARDGSLELSGNLLSFDGEFYRVETKYGVLTLDGSGVLCEGPGCPDLTDYVAEVTLSGAPSMGDVLLPVLLESFAARNGFTVARIAQSDMRFRYELSERDGGRLAGRFTFDLTSSSEGFADLIAGEADIALSLREVTPQEAALGREAGLGDLNAAGRSRIAALDALVPLVSASSTLTRIPLGDLAAVFRGEITDWSAFGGPAEPIELHLRSESSGLTQAFAQRVTPAGALAPDITFHDSDAELADAVADSPFALGVGSFSEIGNAVPLPISGPCGIESAATITDIKTEDYPLTAPLFLYLPGYRLPRLVREFLTYIGSPAAQPVIRRAGFVDQFPGAIPFQQQGARFANAILNAGGEVGLAELQKMVRRLDGHSRLTVTFRFEGGSSTLDAQSRSNVALLAEALERGVFDDRTLLFAGFSDGQGDATVNRRLALSRADTVRDAVRIAARTVDPSRITLQTEAFGEALPMACDEVAWGREVNRRVEVWLKQER
ncbi:phosphate ABC transporter substrate-binding/OmpA family protein [Oceaniglobus roseus]|uniref:phosphate ABC transporter substrate-binding/OmpA family protein n=1 Tax=Oceaniglobus roseus TaxID=1737570 RepID=UPI000C7ECD15|nr:phosphate ABC transporter substrate-binding/OmpA family protein [Kandeliimicrobium roseum]